MCDLCDKQKSEMARRRLAFTAMQLRDLANSLDAVSEGRIKPHTKDFNPVQTKAQGAIHRLVVEFMGS